MQNTHSKLTSQGQVSVPAAVRHALGLTPGSVLEWQELDGQIVVKRAARKTTEDVHTALFGVESPLSPAPTHARLKEGIGEYMHKRYARR